MIPLALTPLKLTLDYCRGSYPPARGGVPAVPARLDFSYFASDGVLYSVVDLG